MSNDSVTAILPVRHVGRPPQPTPTGHAAAGRAATKRREVALARTVAAQALTIAGHEATIVALGETIVRRDERIVALGRDLRAARRPRLRPADRLVWLCRSLGLGVAILGNLRERVGPALAAACERSY